MYIVIVRGQNVLSIQIASTCQAIVSDDNDVKHIILYGTNMFLPWSMARGIKRNQIC